MKENMGEHISHITNLLPVITSTYLRLIRRPNGVHIIYHQLFGNLRVINDSALQLLGLFHQPMTLERAYALYPQYGPLIQAFYNMYYLVDPNADERDVIAHALKTREQQLKTGWFIGGVQLSVSDTCNFNCTYCFCDFVDRRQPKRRELSKRKNKRMTRETAHQVIDQLIRLIKKNGKNALVIKFFGREPLTNWPLIKDILEAYKHGENSGVRIHYAITTNASLVTPEIAETFKTFDVRTTVSIDGLEESNNRVRIAKDKGNTFPSIEKGIRLLASHHNLHVLSAVITDQNFHVFDHRFIDFAKTCGAREVQILLGMQGDFINRLNPDVIVQKLFDLYIYGQKKGIAVTGYWYNSVVEILSTRKWRSDVAVNHGVIESCTATGYQISVEPSGDIFPCRAMATHLGHIATFDELLRSETYSHVVMRTYNNVAECRGCPIEGFCQGECLGNAEEKFNDIYRVDNVYCDIYRKINHKIISLI
ncbi:MAG: radical SAM protein [Candidatus Omnitrophota bacterium]